jgi:Glucose-6-phosphate 1-dehydrogenase
LHDSTVGSQTLFTSTDEVLAEWKFIDSVLAAWRDLPLYTYNKGINPDFIVETK